MTDLRQLDRRDFFKLTGIVSSGLLLGACNDEVPAQTVPGDAFNPSLFISIERDGTVQLVTWRSEMGQGVRTSIPQLIADEMEADWERVRVVQAPADPRYGKQSTDGSVSIKMFWLPARQAGARARHLLETAAAQHWQVSTESCRAELHQVVHSPSGRKIGYGELVDIAKTLSIAEQFTPTLKTPAEFRYIGQSLPAYDLQAMTTGQAQYGIDITLPGMLHACIRRCPVREGKVKSYDDSATRKFAQVTQVIQLPHFDGPPDFKPIPGVAVLATDSWSAQRGRDALLVQWQESGLGGDSAQYLAQLQQLSRRPGLEARNRGDVEAAFASASQVIEADYLVPYLAHASMEPPVATATVNEGKCEVWAPTQSPQKARHTVATLLGLDPADVTINVTLLGGAFGRKSKADFIAEAALLSQAAGAPVKVTWTREDDIRHDYYHAASAQHLKGALDEKGRTTAWLHRAQFPAIATTFADEADNLAELGQGCANLLYDIPNIRAEGGSPPAELRIGWLRSVGNIQQAFAVNSFTHELASAAGRDPAAYLLELLGPARHWKPDKNPLFFSNAAKQLKKFPVDTGRLSEVTRRAMQAADWDQPLGQGSGRGIACHRSFSSYVASVAEVSVGPQGKIHIDRIISVADVGQVVNPDRVRAQLEGAAIFALGFTLYGEISTKEGRVEQSNFHDYRVLRLHETPVIEIELVASTVRPTGVGEPGTPTIAPALCNAIFDASGQRVRQLPLIKQGWVV